MQGVKKTFELNFAGLPFKLRSSHDEKTVHELAEFVDTKMQQALSTLKSGSYQSAAVLAALNIAEELILLRKRVHRELDRLDHKTDRIIEALEASKVSPKQRKKDSDDKAAVEAGV